MLGCVALGFCAGVLLRNWRGAVAPRGTAKLCTRSRARGEPLASSNAKISRAAGRTCFGAEPASKTRAAHSERGVEALAQRQSVISQDGSSASIGLDKFTRATVGTDGRKRDATGTEGCGARPGPPK